MLRAFLLSSFGRLAANVAGKDDAGNKQPNTQPDAAPKEESSGRERYLQALQRAMEHNGFRF